MRSIDKTRDDRRKWKRQLINGRNEGRTRTEGEIVSWWKEGIRDKELEVYNRQTNRQTDR